MNEQQQRRWYWFWGVMLGVSVGIFISSKAESQRLSASHRKIMAAVEDRNARDAHAARQRIAIMSEQNAELKQLVEAIEQHRAICPLQQNLIGAN